MVEAAGKPWRRQRRYVQELRRPPVAYALRRKVHDSVLHKQRLWSDRHFLASALESPFSFVGGFTLSTSLITSPNGRGMCGIGFEFVVLGEGRSPSFVIVFRPFPLIRYAFPKAFNV